MNLDKKHQEKLAIFLEKIEKLFNKQTDSYKFRVAILAILGYGYIILSFCLILVILWSLRQVIISTSSASMASNINWLTFLVSLSTLRLFIINIPKPKGIELQRQQVPNLFNLIDQLTTTLNLPHFQHIILDDQVNAGVLQRPKFGFFGPSENYLVLGLPLMQALSLEQFKAVVAHELAHLSGNHSRFSSWIYRLRKIWSTLAQKYKQSSQGYFSPYTWFFNWYNPFFQSYSFALARENEYYADSCAASWVGGKHKAEALIRLSVTSYYLQQFFWPKIHREAVNQHTPPEGTISSLLKGLLGEEIRKNATLAINLDLAEQTGDRDTHPCLKERLDNLDYQIDWQNLPRLQQESAANYLFGESLSEFAKSLDKFWCQEVAEKWQQIYIKAQQQKDNFDYLSEKAKERDLTGEESYKLAYLTEIFQTQEEAILLYQKIHNQDKLHPAANFQLGRIYLNNQDKQGIGYLEKAMELDPAFVQTSCHLLSRYYQIIEKKELAQKFIALGNKKGDNWKKATKKRRSLGEKDKFSPHLLSEAEIRQLSEQLGTFPEIKTAHLVRKQVTDFPEKPLYVLGISRKFVKGRGASYQHDEQFKDRIETELNFSQELKIVIFSGQNLQIRKNIYKVKNAGIYY